MITLQEYCQSPRDLTSGMLSVIKIPFREYCQSSRDLTLGKGMLRIKTILLVTKGSNFRKSQSSSYLTSGILSIIKRSHFTNTVSYQVISLQEYCQSSRDLISQILLVIKRSHFRNRDVKNQNKLTSHQGISLQEKSVKFSDFTSGIL